MTRHHKALSVDRDYNWCPACGEEFHFDRRRAGTPGAAMRLHWSGHSQRFTEAVRDLAVRSGEVWQDIMAAGRERRTDDHAA